MLTLTNITKTFNAGTVNEKTALDNLSLHLDAANLPPSSAPRQRQIHHVWRDCR